jgi:hypothetical protein
VSLGERVTGLWTNRRDLGRHWWRFVGIFGLSKERYLSWRPWQRRAAKVGLAGVLAFLLSLFVNTLEHFFGQSGGSILTVDASAYIVFLVIAVIIIPEWRALPDLELRVVIPIAILAGLAAGVIIGFATSSTRNGVIAGVGTLIALIAPPWRGRIDPPGGEEDADRQEGRPVDRDRPGDHLSVLRRRPVHDPGLRAGAVGRDGREHDRVHDDGRRPEHGRRLRGAARPRLRRVLRDGRL